MHKSTRPRIHLTRRHYVRLVCVEGASRRQAARRARVHPRTIGRWIEKAEALGNYEAPIRSEPTRPHRPAGRLPTEATARIVALRRQTGRCAPVISELLRREGVAVSVSTVGRILRRRGLTRRRPRVHPARVRSVGVAAAGPGELVQIDTIHIDRPRGNRGYVITLIDVFSRWAHAEYCERLSQAAAVSVLRAAREQAPFGLETVQTDHGPEFGRKFAHAAIRDGLGVVRTRPHCPNDNAYIERFNRTLRGECLRSLPATEAGAAATLSRYLDHYNQERPHLALGLKSPLEILGPPNRPLAGARGRR